MNDRLLVRPAPASPLRPGRNLGRAAARSRRPSAQPRRVPGTHLAGRTAGARSAAHRTPRESGRLPRAEAAGRVRLVVQSRRCPRSRSSTWRLAASCASIATCCLSARQARAKASPCRPSATRPSSKASSCCIARSSTWCASSCMDEAVAGQEKVLARYLKPDLLIVDDMGMKKLAAPERGGAVRDHHAALRNPLDDDDQQPPAGGLGQADRRRAQRHGDSRSLPERCDILPP